MVRGGGRRLGAGGGQVTLPCPFRGQGPGEGEGPATEALLCHGTRPWAGALLTSLGHRHPETLALQTTRGRSEASHGTPVRTRGCNAGQRVGPGSAEETGGRGGGCMMPERGRPPNGTVLFRWRGQSGTARMSRCHSTAASQPPSACTCVCVCVREMVCVCA